MIAVIEYLCRLSVGCGICSQAVKVLDCSSRNHTSDERANQVRAGQDSRPTAPGGGILVTPSDGRQILLSLPGIGIDMWKGERTMKSERQDQGHYSRYAACRGGQSQRDESTSANAATSGQLDRAVEEESLLHYKTQQKAVGPRSTGDT
jgi:hypothetical protein